MHFSLDVYIKCIKLNGKNIEFNLITCTYDILFLYVEKLYINY